MQIIFKNLTGGEEVVLIEKHDNTGVIVFDAYISHSPFSANLPIDFSEKEISLFTSGLLDMYGLRLYSLTLASINRVLVVDIKMEITGMIIATVTLSAGSRGFLKFDFEFDQTFLPEIIQRDWPNLSEKTIRLSSSGNS